MNTLRKNISALIDQLSAAVIAPKSIEAQALNSLSGLLAALQTGSRSAADQRAAQLREVWLNQVPWCSDLSRTLEKVLIQYDESGGNGA